MLVLKRVAHLPVKSSADTQPCCWLWGTRAICLSLKLLVLQDHHRRGGKKISISLLNKTLLFHKACRRHPIPLFRLQSMISFMVGVSAHDRALTKLHGQTWGLAGPPRSCACSLGQCRRSLLLLMVWGTSLVAPALQSPPISLPHHFACTLHSLSGDASFSHCRSRGIAQSSAPTLHNFFF